MGTLSLSTLYISNQKVSVFLLMLNATVRRGPLGAFGRFGPLALFNTVNPSSSLTLNILIKAKPSFEFINLGNNSFARKLTDDLLLFSKSKNVASIF
jgi:hypothetical protein